MCSQITTVGIDWKALCFEKSHTFDGYVFATPGERCWYVRLSLPHPRQQWLREHPDRWRRIEDVRQEAAPPAPPVETEIDLGAEPVGPNGQTYTVVFGTTAAKKMTSPRSILWPNTARSARADATHTGDNNG